jgi:hypothetical protein
LIGFQHYTGDQIGEPRSARSDGIVRPSMSVMPYCCANSALMKLLPVHHQATSAAP